MKKKFLLLLVLCAVFFGNAQTIGKNGTVQMPNLGFEEYHTETYNKKTGDVPNAWNSFLSADGNFLTNLGKENHGGKKEESRPGSIGQYCFQIFSTEPIKGTIANGNITTGKINMGSMTAIDASNHNSTKRTQSGYNLPFPIVPDSIVVWIKFNPKNAVDIGRLNAVLHNDNDEKDPGYNNANVVAEATMQFRDNINQWVRYSAPFRSDATFGSVDPAYMLITVTTNETPGKGSKGDEVFIDDLLFIYNPEIKIPELAHHKIEVFEENPVNMNIPFEIKGIMSPNNLKVGTEEAWLNEVRIELSDKDGSFDNPITLGSMLSDTGATLTCTIPAAIPVGTAYKIRMLTTNYPLVYEYPNTLTFEKGRVSVSAQSTPAGKGSITGLPTQKVEEGSTLTLHALAASGNRFVKWTNLSGDSLSNVNPYTFEVQAEVQLMAVFDTLRYNVNIASFSEHFGSVTGMGTQLPLNSSISLTATPNAHFTFVNFKDGSNTHASPYNFTLTQNRSLTPVFDTLSYAITLSKNQATWGSVTGDGNYKHYKNVSLKATPVNKYFKFKEWQFEGLAISTENPYIFVCEGAKTIEAVFEEAAYPLAHIKTNDELLGTVRIGEGEFTDETNYLAKYNESITIEAQVVESNLFSHWANAAGVTLSSNPIYTFSITDSILYTAIFAESLITINGTVSPEGSGIIENLGTQAANVETFVKAVSNQGYHFVAWTNQEGSTDIISSKDSLPFIATDTVFHALFAVNTYAVDLICDKNKGVLSESIPDSAKHFSTLTLGVVPLYGYRFIGWYNEEEMLVSADPTYSFEITGAIKLRAEFSPLSYNVEADLYPSDKGEVEGSGSFDYLSSVSLTATAAPNFYFKEWQSKGESISTENPLIFTLIQDTIFTAVFRADTFEILTKAIPVEGGSVTEIGKLAYLTPFTIKAIPNQGYRFVEWVKGTNRITEDTAYSAITTENTTYTAFFEKNQYSIATSASPITLADSVKGGGKYNAFDTVYLKAEEVNGYVFDKWVFTRISHTSTLFSEEDLRNPLLAIEMIENIDITARYTINTFAITADITPVEAGTLNGVGNYPYGGSARLTATAHHGYVFKEWLLDGEKCEDSNVMTTSVREALHFTAVFEKKKFNVQVSIYPVQAATLYVDQEIQFPPFTAMYSFQSPLSLSVQTNEGYRFLAWMNSKGREESTELEYICNLQDNITLTATFEAEIGIDNEKESQLRIYPNPCKGDYVYVIGEGLRSIEIYSMDGQMKIRKDLRDMAQTLNVQSLRKGIYIYKILRQDGSLRSGKLLKF